MVYRYREGVKLKLDPQVVGETLERIAAAHGGRLDSESIVDAARARTSALHSYFDWDVREAAHRHWVAQAEYLRRVVVVVLPAENGNAPIPVRLFQKVQTEADGEAVYVSATIYRQSPDMVDQIVQGLLRRARTLMSEATQYERLEPLASALKGALDQILPPDEDEPPAESPQ